MKFDPSLLDEFSYDIYYAKEPGFGLVDLHNFTRKSIMDTHVFLGRVDSSGGFDAVFTALQFEREDTTEIRDRIRSKGLTHTSMSIGDVICCNFTGDFYVLTSFKGWRLL